MILAPCGFSLEEVFQQAGLLAQYPDWDKISAVRNDLLYAVDANSYFARPGPRIIDGLELLAHLIHPEEFGWLGKNDAYRRVGLKDVLNLVSRKREEG